METEKLDKLLGSSVLKHEETYKADFDRNRVWRKSTGNKRRKNLAIGISIAATVLFALNILWTGGDKELVKEYKQVNNPDLASRPPSVEGSAKKQFPVTSGTGKKIPVFAEKLADNITEHPVPLTSETIAVMPQLLNDSKYSNNPSVPAVMPVQVQNIPPDAEEVKVTFKRGGPPDAGTRPDFIATIRKGSKLKIDLKRPSADSLYYADTRNNLRLTLKSLNK